MTRKQQIDSDIRRVKLDADKARIEEPGKGSTDIDRAFRLATEVEHLRGYSEKLAKSYALMSSAYDKLKCYTAGYSRK